MNKKKYLIAATVSSAALLALASRFGHDLPCHAQAQGVSSTVFAALGNSAPKFGPEMEAVLPSARTNGLADILDLETGRTLAQEPFEHFRFRADAIMAWIRSNGLDISCNIWSTGATCVTYDMAIVAVASKAWEKTTEEELVANPALAPTRHSRRKLLVLGPNRPNTYIFRTSEGSFGMLRLVGLTEDGRGIKIRYKMINSSKTFSLAG
jgi:hypothetical protein